MVRLTKIKLKKVDTQENLMCFETSQKVSISFIKQQGTFVLFTTTYSSIIFKIICVYDSC